MCANELHLAAVGASDGFVYLSQEHPSLWLSIAKNESSQSKGMKPQLTAESGAAVDTTITAQQRKVETRQDDRLHHSRVVQSFSFASVNLSTGAGQSMERFLHTPTAAAAAAAAARRATRRQGRPSKYADPQYRTTKQKKKKKHKSSPRLSRQQVAKRAELWPMDFLHTYFLGERPVVVTDAVPIIDMQSLFREDIRTHHSHSLVHNELTLPYFLDTDSMATTVAAMIDTYSQSSNPNLFSANASTFFLEDGKSHRGVACGAQLVMVWGEQSGGAAAPTEVVLRPPPLSAADCLSRTRERGGSRDESEPNTNLSEDPTLVATSRPGTEVAEGRWNHASCIHVGKATR